MDTQNSSKSPSARHSASVFLEALRTNGNFRLDMKRVGLIALTAVIVDTAMFGLALTDWISDANTHQVIVFASYAATLVIVAAAVTFVIRVLDEYLRFCLDRAER
jgi:uncharacterized membrane protein YcjF (UPF0283 family)